MTDEEVLKIYQELINDPQKLRVGGQKLEGLLNKQSNFGLATCKAITNPDLEVNFRKLIGYLVKNVLRDNWMANSALASQRKVLHRLFHCYIFGLEN